MCVSVEALHFFLSFSLFFFCWGGGVVLTGNQNKATRLGGSRLGGSRLGVGDSSPPTTLEGAPTLKIHGPMFGLEHFSNRRLEIRTESLK